MASRRRSRVRLLPALPILFVFCLLLPPAPRAEDDYPHGDFQGDCTTCHSGDEFFPPQIQPEFRKKEHPFPLRQAHDLPNCRSCHTTLDFTKAPKPLCASCHEDPHRGEMGVDCARCHVPRTFIDRSRMQELHMGTRFPLRGTHRSIDCDDCHGPQPQGALRYVNTPADCVDCHRGAYQSAARPNHVAAGLPTTCDLCHVPTVWQDGKMNHALVTSPCVTCHLQDYQGTRDPNHTAAGFPTDCQLCHVPGRDWHEARFVHDPVYFPIYAGTHAGTWSACSNCHVSPSDFSQFSCLGCHPHSDAVGTRHVHEGIPGFTYNSPACYACHPRGVPP